MLREKAGDFELKVLPGGFGAWFTRLCGTVVILALLAMLTILFRQAKG
jgi:hypothetical protein